MQIKITAGSSTMREGSRMMLPEHVQQLQTLKDELGKLNKYSFR